MGSGKKDLEIVYNLQWKNVSGHGDDKANVVGMYDIPATTLNWETFKSYLLKNSGATGDDVKVSYVSIDDKEFPIESQLDFQIALYSFRQRARNGDIITLKLDRISDSGRVGRTKRLRRSAEPRMEEEKVPVVTETSNPLPQSDGAPDWFKKYMKGFKKEIVEEVTASMVSYMKVQNSMYFPCYHSRKSKVECCKRPRKAALHSSLGEPNNDKDTIKSMKLERKLDSKLEKLEQKTMKIKEKKLALVRSSENEGGRNNTKSRPIGMPLSDTEFLMDASAVGQHESTIPHMSGGETYQQEWEVINTGEMSWTSNTELRYAWGSEALKPVEKTVPCPKLNPGEKGTVVVYLEIPRKPGNYECYWHFYHDCRRFGHWLGCHIIVDPSCVKSVVNLGDGAKNVSSESFIKSWASTPKKLKKDELDLDMDALDALCAERRNNLKFCMMSKSEVDDNKPLNTSAEGVEDKEIEIHNAVGAALQALQIEDTVIISDASSSDSDNQSIVSIADSNSSINSAPSDEFVVVPMPQCITADEANALRKELEAENLDVPVCAKIKLEKVDCPEPNNPPIENSDNNNNTEEAPTAPEKPNESGIKIKEEVVIKTEIQDSDMKTELVGYAYVTVNGRRIAVPKWLLRTDFLKTAENAPEPKSESNEDITLVGFETVQPMQENNPTNSTDEQKGTDAIQNPKVTQSIYASAECIPKSPLEDDTISNKTNYSSKSRLFVFPLKCPGFEVVYPPNTMSESLPLELNESFESNRSSMAIDGSTMSLKSCGPGYDCKIETKPDSLDCNQYLSNPVYIYPAANPTASSTYPPPPSFAPPPSFVPPPSFTPPEFSWSKSSSAYSYCENNPPTNSTLLGHSFIPPPPPPPVNPDAHAQANENGARNRLHHRFGTYMKHRAPFNHSKQCGVHCQQPLSSGLPWAPKHNGSPWAPKQAGNYPPNWAQTVYGSANSYQHPFGSYATASSTSSAASTKVQSPIHTNNHEEVPTSPPGAANERSATIHILPDTLVSGAVNAASSAINTARSVLNMFTPAAPPSEPIRQEQTMKWENGQYLKWENGQWIPNDAELPRERALRILAEMGFWDRELNTSLLARYNDDLARVISELVQ